MKNSPIKKTLSLLLSLIFCFITLSACSDSAVTTKEDFAKKWDIDCTKEDVKVIIDADVYFLNDDSLAIFAAAQADSLSYVDLLGVTLTGGNTFVACGAYDMLSQLEQIGRPDIPVYIGEEEPLNGWLDISEYKKVAGDTGFVGCYGDPNNHPDDYKKAKGHGATSPLKEPTITPQEQSSVDFIIEQAHKYEGKLTLICLGGLMNIALAVQKDPSIVDCIREIIYMGGVFDTTVGITPNIEFNFWFDPMATNICLSQKWKKQTVVSHDSATTCIKDENVYKKYKSKNNTAITQLLVDSLAPIYENGLIEDPIYCWDLLTIAYLLYPSTCVKIDSRYIYVDERPGMTYGKTYNWTEKTHPETVKNKCDVILAVDSDTVWDLVSDLYSIKY